LQPTLALWRTAARPRLELVLASGVRSLRGAIGVMDSVRVDLGANGGPADNPFFNINRPEDMVVAQAWLESVRQGSLS
jgi:molybdopterin-guanine dinucleotide biosynthesis protein A